MGYFNGGAIWMQVIIAILLLYGLWHWGYNTGWRAAERQRIQQRVNQSPDLQTTFQNEIYRIQSTSASDGEYKRRIDDLYRHYVV